MNRRRATRYTDLKRDGDQRVAARRPGVGGGDGGAGVLTSATQRKFSAWSMLPLPTYLATCGYGHSGLVRFTRVSDMCIAVIRAGARPSRIQRSSAPTASKISGPSPPQQ